MRQIFSLLCLVLLISLGAPQAAYAQTISNQIPMRFGQMIIGGAGTVTVRRTADTRTSTGAIALVGTAPITRGSITITYTPGAQVTITVPASVTMTAPSFPTLQPLIQGGSTQTIPPTGILVVYFGGVINFTTGGISGPASALIPVEVLPL